MILRCNDTLKQSFLAGTKQPFLQSVRHPGYVWRACFSLSSSLIQLIRVEGRTLVQQQLARGHRLRSVKCLGSGLT